MKAIRGAHTAKENTVEAIRECTLELLNEMISVNDLKAEEMVHIIFSATKDLTKVYPAKCAREIQGLDQVPLFCVQEMYVEGSLPSCIRVMLLTERDHDAAVKHVYLGGAKKLRPDLQDK